MVPLALLPLLLASLALLGAPARGDPLRLEVSPDGSGDFSSVQQAIDHVPDGASEWTLIHVGAGSYFERLEIPLAKRRLILEGDGRDETLLAYDGSYVDSLGRLVAFPVLVNRASEVVVRALGVHNLAKEPGGSGGKWDAAVMNFGDRLILDDVFLRGDHDTLLMYGPAYNGPGRGRVYVRASHLQGRGDFVASFTSAFIEDTLLETIRDPGHFLFQTGAAGPGDPDALVVKNSTLTGQSTDPVWPAGATNLDDRAYVVLVGNAFEDDVGANRPVVHFHAGFQAASAKLLHFGDVQRLSPAGPLIWERYSIPGPPGTPRLERAVGANDHGEPMVRALSAAEAERITPAWLFGDWNPADEPVGNECANGLDDDGDGTIDLADPGCTSSADFSELSVALRCDNGLDDDADGRIDFAGGDPGCAGPATDRESPPPPSGGGWGCGLGIELVAVLPLLRRLRRSR